ncbi:hypothetical protein FRC03_006708 [Tulasnella sp. 419]|nr:hypothetical protein FRC03_006708 [Tulasnella sp. 419]
MSSKITSPMENIESKPFCASHEAISSPYQLLEPFVFMTRKTSSYDSLVYSPISTPSLDIPPSPWPTPVDEKFTSAGSPQLLSPFVFMRRRTTSSDDRDNPPPILKARNQADTVNEDSPQQRPRNSSRSSLSNRSLRVTEGVPKEVVAETVEKGTGKQVVKIDYAGDLHLSYQLTLSDGEEFTAKLHSAVSDPSQVSTGPGKVAHADKMIALRKNGSSIVTLLESGSLLLRNDPNLIQLIVFLVTPSSTPTNVSKPQLGENAPHFSLRPPRGRDSPKGQRPPYTTRSRSVQNIPSTRAIFA